MVPVKACDAGIYLFLVTNDKLQLWPNSAIVDGITWETHRFFILARLLFAYCNYVAFAFKRLLLAISDDVEVNHQGYGDPLGHQKHLTSVISFALMFRTQETCQLLLFDEFLTVIWSQPLICLAPWLSQVNLSLLRWIAFHERLKKAAYPDKKNGVG